MKKLVPVTEVQGEGLLRLMGEQIYCICARYIYAGKLVGVNDDCVLLEDAVLVYETGSWNKKGWTDAQKLPGDSHYVQRGFIESFGLAK